mmetsp:Transcript_43381/g.77931  ORF Transcript_43381/g.77931 Transcript_43381/m.77931 type:complete len:91 (-) Transcript_43381:327-599(-)
MHCLVEKNLDLHFYFLYSLGSGLGTASPTSMPKLWAGRAGPVPPSLSFQLNGQSHHLLLLAKKNINCKFVILCGLKNFARSRWHYSRKKV